MATTTTEPAPRQSTGRRIVKNLRWWIMIWLLLAAIINYMDRSALSIAAPNMISELGLNKTDIGLLGSVFSVTYGLCQLPAGWIIDKFGAKRLYWMSMAWWSLATALMAFGATMWQFVTFRFLLGIGESPVSPMSAKVTASWFPRSERGQSTSIWDSGSKWGPAIAPPVLTAIMIAFGWRSIFLFLGVLGLVVAVAFFLWYRTPEESRRLSEAEYEHIKAGRDDHTAKRIKLSWGTLFKYRQVWGMILGYFCIIWIWQVVITFMPLFLQEEQGVSIAQTGVFAAIPFVGAALMEYIGGWATKRAQRNGRVGSLAAKRRVMIVIVIIAGVIICAVPFSANLLIAMITLTLSIGFIAMSQGVAWSLPGEIVPDSHVASVGAIQNFGGYFGGALAPLLSGIFIDTTGNYYLVFIVGGVIAACASIFYGIFVRRPIADQTGVRAVSGRV